MCIRKLEEGGGQMPRCPIPGNPNDENVRETAAHRRAKHQLHRVSKQRPTFGLL